MPNLAGANECTSFDEVGEIAGRCSGRCPRDGHVVAGAQTTLEALGAFLEHSQESSFLSCVDLAMQAVEELRFRDDEFNLRDAASLGLERDSGKPG